MGSRIHRWCGPFVRPLLHFGSWDTKAINVTNIVSLPLLISCTDAEKIYIYTYNTLFGHFQRITLASGSSTRSIQTSGHNEKIFSRPLPSRGSRMVGNRCDATGNQTLPLRFVRFIGQIGLISYCRFTFWSMTRSRCHACQESRWWNSTIESIVIRASDQRRILFPQKSIPLHQIA